MKTLPLLSSLLFAGVFSMSAQEIDPAHEPVEINFRFQAGKTYKSQMVSKSSSEMVIEGQDAGSNQTMTMDYTTKVTGIEGSENVKLTLAYDRIAMDMTAAGQKMSFDSAKPETLTGNPLGSIAGMVGKSITMTISPKMEVTKIEGVDQLFEGLGAGGEMARGMFSDDQFKQMMGGQIAAMIPNKKVKAGDEWPYKLKMPLGPMGTMSVDGKNTMKGVLTKEDAKLAVVEYTASVDSKKQDGENDLGMAMEFKDSKLEGSYHFDLAEGYVTKTTTKMKMTLIMAIPGQDEKLSVPSTSTVTMTTQME